MTLVKAGSRAACWPALPAFVRLSANLIPARNCHQVTIDIERLFVVQ